MTHQYYLNDGGLTSNKGQALFDEWTLVQHQHGPFPPQL